MAVNINVELTLMTELDVRRRGDSLACPHPKPPKGNPRHVVMLWDRDSRLPLTGHPDYSPGFLCSSCFKVYTERLG